MKDLVIIASVIPERLPLLRRSLITWQSSIDASGLDCEICLFIEGTTICDALKYIPDGVGCKIEGGMAKSGSHIFGYDYWYERMQAKTYLFTHGEMMFPEDTVATAYALANDDTYVAFKCYWLSPDMTRDLDQFNWREPNTLVQEAMLFELDELLKGSFYANATVREIAKWESSTTYCINRQTAERMYPMPDFGAQGADDPYQAGLRLRLGITNHTVMNPILFHQYHPSSWYGTGEEAVQEAAAELVKRFGW